jgi:thioredoxin reductase (NADPH)
MVMAKTVAIIGAGPAGMAAALQLHRFGINALLFDQKNSKSLLKNAWCVENYLGCYPGRAGVKLLRSFRMHLTKNKVKIIRNKVENLDFDVKTHLFKIKTAKRIYSSGYVIVASGTKPRLLIQKPTATANMRLRLLYEVFPLLNKRNKTVVIIGAGDAAFDNALNLAKYNQVIICNRTKHINALPLLANKTIKHRNITYFQEHELRGIAVTRKKVSMVFTNRNKNVYIEADYLLVAIGRLPQKDFYTNKFQAIAPRLIKIGKLFLAGDVKNDFCRQVAIAVGDGINIAMYIFHKLTQHDFKNY